MCVIELLPSMIFVGKSPVISKLFEHAILDRFGHYFLTSDNQFGFKKNLSCRHVAIFGKVGRIASEDVIIELLKAKCLPALY